MFSLFSYSFIHQYLPTTLSPVDWIRYRKQKVRNVYSHLATENVLSQDVISNSSDTDVTVGVDGGHVCRSDSHDVLSQDMISNNQIDVTLDDITEQYLMYVRIPSKDHFIGLSKNHHCCFSHPHYHPVEIFIPNTNYPQNNSSLRL